MKRENEEKPKKHATRVTFSMKSGNGEERINTDPLGSYTGVPDNPYDVPVQDADDL